MREEAGGRKLVPHPHGASGPGTPARNVGKQETVNSPGAASPPGRGGSSLPSCPFPTGAPGYGGHGTGSAGEKAALGHIPPAPRAFGPRWVGHPVTTAPFPETYSGEKLRQEPAQGPHRPHFSTFLQGLGRCQGARGSRVKVGWLITTAPPLEALDGRLAHPAPPPGPGRGRPRSGLSPGGGLLGEGEGEGAATGSRRFWGRERKRPPREKQRRLLIPSGLRRRGPGVSQK